MDKLLDSVSVSRELLRMREFTPMSAYLNGGIDDQIWILGATVSIRVIDSILEEIKMLKFQKCLKNTQSNVTTTYSINGRHATLGVFETDYCEK